MKGNLMTRKDIFITLLKKMSKVEVLFITVFILGFSIITTETPLRFLFTFVMMSLISFGMPTFGTASRVYKRSKELEGKEIYFCQKAKGSFITHMFFIVKRRKNIYLVPFEKIDPEAKMDINEDDLKGKEMINYEEKMYHLIQIR